MAETYTAQQLRVAAGSESARRMMIPDSASAGVLAQLIPVVSEAVGNDVNPYQSSGLVDRERFPNGVNPAAYLRCRLHRFAVAQQSRAPR